MAKKTMVINGETFELSNVIVPRNIIRVRSLEQCYGRPSYAKQSIYEYWSNWFRSVGADWLQHGISSYNCNYFTYNGYFEYNGKEYYACITYAHNRLYEVA